MVRDLYAAPLFRRVTELGYVLVLETRFCGFEPHPAYHLRRVRIAAIAVVLKATKSR